MKVRNGFVSNSSTSSFVCDICGEKYEGWDASPSDPDFECSVCENEHIMCNSHLEGVEIESLMAKDEERHIPSKYCPICNFQTYAEGEMVTYLEKTRKVSKDEVFVKVKAINKRRKKLYNAEYITDVCQKFSLTDELLLKEIKDKFGNYDAYAKFLRSKE